MCISKSQLKLLVVTSAIQDKKIRSRGGLAVMVRDLYSNFSKSVQTEIFLARRPQNGLDLGYAKVLDSSVWRLLKQITRVKFSSVRIGGEIKQAIKSLYSIFASAVCIDYIQNNHYDIVNIHDLNETTLSIIKYCETVRIPCIVTMHIYIGKNNVDRRMYWQQAEWEHILFHETSSPIIVVGSGMKIRILHDYNFVAPERISVVSNGTILPNVEESLHRHETGNRTDGKKVILCIGSFIKRKNQFQVLRALDILDKTVQEQIKVIFIGEGPMLATIQYEASERKLNNIVEFVGQVDHEKMSYFYKSAFATISTSLNEAFGLTIIEGYCYGVPAIFFDDIDAARELYSPDAAVLIKGKSNQDVANAIKTAVCSRWDSQKIKEYSMKFDIRETASKYKKIYYHTCRKSTSNE